jgi:aspartate carbamoyltransferase catalytic subunit
MSKGESIEDTVRVVSTYADLLVLRHEVAGAVARAAVVSNVPVINAGDGSNEHPTQALVDLYTILHERGRLEGLRVGAGFDPLHSRSIHSLCGALSQFPDNEVILVGPEELWLDRERLTALEASGLRVRQSSAIGDLLDCEVAYLNRFQVERFADSALAGRYREQYRLRASDIVDSSIQLVLDPLPRIHEIDEDVDALPEAGYFRQAAFGVPVRMAILSLLGRRIDPTEVN